MKVSWILCHVLTHQESAHFIVKIIQNYSIFYSDQLLSDVTVPLFAMHIYREHGIYASACLKLLLLFARDGTNSTSPCDHALLKLE